ncbi:MAG: DUF4142 domain-containing protein [Pyrinomonadaceae bacterium]|nr:DUF4142 domain-containing protein [Pyrinomonadaceae bacterium]
MKNLTQVFFVFLAALTLFGCDNGSGSSSNRNSTTNGTTVSNTNQLNTNAENLSANKTIGNNPTNVAVVQDNFWEKAAQGGLAEVELAKIALTNSKNAEVKNFANMMVTDHTKVNNELKELAAKKKVVLPLETDSSHKSTLEDFKKLTGDDFDKKYVEAMVADHEEDIKMFEDQSQDNSDPDLKAFAANTLPKLKTHLEAIKKIQFSMKK